MTMDQPLHSFVCLFFSLRIAQVHSNQVKVARNAAAAILFSGPQARGRLFVFDVAVAVVVCVGCTCCCSYANATLSGD